MATITKPHCQLNASWQTNLIVIIAFSMLCSLGYWQLSRARHKENLIGHHLQAAEGGELDNQSLLTQTDFTLVRYCTVKLHGSFDNARPILLDNKIKNGQIGYQLFLPFILDPQTRILVDRGWVAAPPSRSTLPQIFTEIGEVTIEGYLDFAYRNPFISTAIESTYIQWPLRMQQLDLDLLSRAIGKKVLPVLVTLRENKHLTFPVSPDRHRGYAMQWFGLAIALLVVYFFVIRQKEPT